MTRPDPSDPSPAGVRAGKARLWPTHGQQKTLPFEGQGRYSIRASSASELALLELRITPKTNFGATRNESFSE